MTKGEIRRARRAANAAGVPLTGELAINKISPKNLNLAKPFKRARTNYASKALQHARYIDCGPGNWDDR